MSATFVTLNYFAIIAGLMFLVMYYLAMTSRVAAVTVCLVTCASFIRSVVLDEPLFAIVINGGLVAAHVVGFAAWFQCGPWRAPKPKRKSWPFPEGV